MSETDEKDDLVMDFAIAKLDGKFLRFKTAEMVPSGIEAITEESINEMTKEKLGELYGAVAGVEAKKFKDRRVAVDSLLYQFGKLPKYDPVAPAETKPAKATAPAKVGKHQKKDTEVYKVMSPPNSSKILGGLAPQARELFLIMVELAESQNSDSFSGADLDLKLNQDSSMKRLNTRQDPGRILSYYKGKMIGLGLIQTS